MAETQEFDALIIGGGAGAESPATAPCAGYVWR